MPTLKDLSNHVVPEVDTKWYMLGLQLLNTDDVKKLTSIESDYRGSVETCCTKMFGQWLDTVPTANWGQLITALKAPIVKLHKLADNLTKLLGKCVHICMYVHMYACMYYVCTSVCTRDLRSKYRKGFNSYIKAE